MHLPPPLLPLRSPDIQERAVLTAREQDAALLEALAHRRAPVGLAVGVAGRVLGFRDGPVVPRVEVAAGEDVG